MLHYKGYYDYCFLHGTFEGSVYGDKPIGNGRLFKMSDFDMCKGFMVGGHVHTPGCHKGYFYYTGSPYRWKFGEEEDKGFLTTLYNTETCSHYVNFNKIESFRYITIEWKEAVKDPKLTIEYINRIQKEQGIDFLRVKFNVPVNGSDKVIIQNYYKHNSNTTVNFLDVMEERKLEDKANGVLNSDYDFILDNQLSDIEKFVRFVNMKEGSEFITIDKLKEILDEQI
jgi:DNA repair exonuclease SbcCD nuclease subunit